ncbi:MAG: hypothetical protein LW817_00410 [Candidatus Caenarcaniphilales bacterium]|jgi:hypothetical protein|nr:hypothetical protein [Candidatus Caenarcaniphilales bacterium]
MKELFHNTLIKQFQRLRSERDSKCSLAKVDENRELEYDDLAAYAQNLRDNAVSFASEELFKQEESLVSFLEKRKGDFESKEPLDLKAIIEMSNLGFYQKQRKELQDFWQLNNITYEQAAFLDFLQAFARISYQLDKRKNIHEQLWGAIAKSFEDILVGIDTAKDQFAFAYDAVSEFLRVKIVKMTKNFDASNLFGIQKEYEQALQKHQLPQVSIPEMRSHFLDSVVIFRLLLGDEFSENLEMHLCGMRGRDGSTPKEILENAKAICEVLKDRWQLALDWQKEVLGPFKKFAFDLGDKIFKQNGLSQKIFDAYDLPRLMEKAGFKLDIFCQKIEEPQ